MFFSKARPPPRPALPAASQSSHPAAAAMNDEPLFRVNGFGDIRYQAPEVRQAMANRVTNGLWQYPEMRDILSLYNDPALMEQIENLVLVACALKRGRDVFPPTSSPIKKSPEVKRKKVVVPNAPQRANATPWSVPPPKSSTIGKQH